MQFSMEELRDAENLEEARDARLGGVARGDRAAHELPNRQREVRIPVGGHQVDFKSILRALECIAAKDVRRAFRCPAAAGDEAQQG